VVLGLSSPNFEWSEVSVVRTLRNLVFGPMFEWSEKISIKYDCSLDLIFIQNVHWFDWARNPQVECSEVLTVQKQNEVKVQRSLV